MVTRQYQSNDDDEKKLSTPTMNRSRNQLAAAYAPGAFFTFEGGLGSCIAVPDQSDMVDQASIQEPTKEQIVLRLREVWQSWFTRAYSLNGNGRDIEGASSLVLNVNGDTRQWVYRSDTGNWTKITNLLSTDQLPFPSEFDDYFIISLATRINPRYGQSLSPENIEALKRTKSQLRARYRSTKSIYPEYMGLLGERRQKSFNENTSMWWW